MFHLPLRVPNAMFDELDDDDKPVPVSTPATTTDAAIAPVQPEWDANNVDTNEVFVDLGITFVDGVPVFRIRMMNLILYMLLMRL